LAIAQQNVSLRQKVFPFKERYKILKSLPYELEDDIPFLQEDAVFEAKMLGYRKNVAKILGLACPRKHVESTLQRGRDAGINPDILSVEGVALSSLFENWSHTPPELDSDQAEVVESTNVSEIKVTQPAIISLHLGHERTLLVVLQNGFPVTMRTIFWGGVEIIKNIQKRYDLPYAEALKGLREKGFVLTVSGDASPEQVSFSETISSALGPMIVEVKRSLMEIQGDFSLNYDKIEISGGVTPLLNLGPYLTEEFEIPCSSFNPLARFSFGHLNVDQESHPRLAIALGLAVEGLRAPKNPPVNFRKGDFAKKNLTLNIFWNKWNQAIKIAAVALVCFFFYSMMRETATFELLEKSKTALKKQARKSRVVGKISVVKTRLFIKQKRREQIAQKTLGRLQGINSALGIMKKLSETVPTKAQITIDIRRFRLIEEELTLEGQIAKKRNLKNLTKTFKAFSSDGNIRELKPSFKPDPNHIAFAYTFKVNRRRAAN